MSTSDRCLCPPLVNRSMVGEKANLLVIWEMWTILLVTMAVRNWEFTSLLKPKEEQQPKKEEHLGIFGKNLDIFVEGNPLSSQAHQRKESTNKEKKHLQRKTHRKEKSTNKGKHIEGKAQTKKQEPPGCSKIRHKLVAECLKSKCLAHDRYQTNKSNVS